MATAATVYKQVKVTGIIDETADCKTFVLEPVNWQPQYEAGQFLTFIFTHHDKEERRSYSISSSPLLDEPLQVTIKRIPNGQYSRWFFTQVSPGSLLTVAEPGGFFRLPSSYENIDHLFFLAAGSGITPVYSLIKTALCTTALPVTLVYSNSRERDIIFHPSLLELNRLFPERFTIRFLFSDHYDIYHSRLSKTLLNHLLQLYNIPLDKTFFYTCGPENYMLMASITLITAGVARERIRKENFDSRPHVVVNTPPDTNDHTVTIILKDAEHRFTVHYPDTILTAAKKQGVLLPYSCETGRCGSCAARCTQGKVWLAYNEVLLEKEISRGMILTCQGHPVGGDATIVL